MQRLINQLIPFILLGIALVVFAFGIVLFVYLFIFGAAIGLILYLFNWVKGRFFPKKDVPPEQMKVGRIIDSDDWKEL